MFKCLRVRTFDLFNGLFQGRVLLLFLIFYASTLTAQKNQGVADSIRNIYEKTAVDDSSKLVMLKKLVVAEPSPLRQVKYAQALITLAGQKKLYEDLHFGHMYLGNAYKNLGNPIKALDTYFQSVEIAEKNGFTRGIGEAYSTIADTYKKNLNFDLAKVYYLEASKIFEELQDSARLAIVYFNFGYGLYQSNQLDSAKELTLKGAKLFETYYPSAVNYANGNLALIDLKLGTEGAYDSLERVILELKGLGDNFAVSDYLSQLSGILKDQGKIEDAILVAEESLTLSMKLGLKEQIRDASESLCELYKAKGDFEKALNYQSQFILYKDSINNIETVNQMANQRTEFEIGQAEARMDAERQTQQVIRYALISGLGLLMIFGITQYRNSRQRMATNKMLRDQKAELEAQKEALEEVNRTKDRFFSIISHDLRGPVNAFHGISRMIKFFVQNRQLDQLDDLAEEIDQSVDRLSSLLDNLLNWAVQQQGDFPYVPEKIDVFEMADDLVKTLTTMAHSKSISLVNEIVPGMEAWADRNTTMTIIRNLVSNALKFTPEQGSVHITSEKVSSFVLIKVSDTGVGIPQEKIDDLFTLESKKSTWGTSGEKGLGLGLQLVNEFVELNKGKIEVESSEHGTTFTIKLPAFESIPASQTVTLDELNNR